jgi:hypothetical protein
MVTAAAGPDHGYGVGREDALMHWCALHQIKARELNLVGYEDEDD